MSKEIKCHVRINLLGIGLAPGICPWLYVLIPIALSPPFPASVPRALQRDEALHRQAEENIVIVP